MLFKFFAFHQHFLSGHVQGKAKYELMCEIFYHLFLLLQLHFPTQKSVFNDFSCIADRFLNR